MRIYTKAGYVLGDRCSRGHSGNRRYVLITATLGECQGCCAFDGMRQFGSRAEALAADRAFVARWPEDSASDVLAGKRI